jgi:type VI protein secretion system component Hcp
LLAVTNRVIPTATIFLSKLGDAPIDFFTAVLENVVVGTVELVEVDDGLTPTERVTLLPTRATLTYVQKPDGSPGPTSTSLITCP